QKYSYTSSSVANKINILHHFFRFLHNSGYIKVNPAILIRPPRKRVKIPKVFNDIELEKFLSATEHNIYTKFKKYSLRDKLIFTMFAYTGLRRTELINLNWNDINLGNKYLIVRKSKNKNQRIIPLHDKVLELLDKYLSERLPLKNNALFIGNTCQRIHHNSLKNLFDRYIKITGLSGKGYTIHTLRHTFATRLLSKDVSLVNIKNLMGHKSLESTQIYLHVTGKELEESIKVL
ncbi:MAG: tyrosine-type recombinase/integrase, partial [Cyanobacteria bacterium]|nr:tyrosine-type recombinase/integrase [Cyanobacteriota bacterium]